MQTQTLSELWAQARQIIKTKRERGTPEFPTGISWLDEVTGGMNRGEIWIIAAKPGLGKTALALQLAREFADNPQNKVAFFSLEMRGWQLMLRMFCEINNVDHSMLITGKEDIAEGFSNSFQKFIEGIDFEIIESGYIFEEVEATIKQLYEQDKPDIIFLDFVQLVEWKQFKDERVAITEYIRKIKEMANKYNIGFVIVSQIRRLPSGADMNREPDISDLKGTGALEAVADKILIIYREILKGQFGNDIKYFINLAKNRQGELRKEQVVFEGWRYHFRELKSQDNKQLKVAQETFGGEIVS